MSVGQSKAIRARQNSMNNQIRRTEKKVLDMKERADQKRALARKRLAFKTADQKGPGAVGQSK